jgi:hypothetical protein
MSDESYESAKIVIESSIPRAPSGTKARAVARRSEKKRFAWVGGEVTPPGVPVIPPGCAVC